MLQSNANQYLSRYLTWINIIGEYTKRYSISKEKILDIGCATGKFKLLLGKHLEARIIGVDPNKNWVNTKKLIYHGYCHKTPFEKQSFDFILLMSVFEHIHPNLRKSSIEEILRILKPNGFLFVQMPNPKFPLEFHTRLPLLGYLPRKVQFKYAQLVRNRGLGFWSISLDDSLKYVVGSMFTILDKREYRYPKQVFPKVVRRFYFLTRFFHMGSYAILRKK